MTENCDRLNSGLSNYIIPKEIQELGEDKCREFRKWLKKNEGLLEDDADKFYKRLKKKYGVTEIPKILINYLSFTCKSCPES